MTDQSTVGAIQSGFTAGGQAVVANQFGGYSPVIGGKVQAQSSAAPVTPASINYINGQPLLGGSSGGGSIQMQSTIAGGTPPLIANAGGSEQAAAQQQAAQQGTSQLSSYLASQQVGQAATQAQAAAALKSATVLGGGGVKVGDITYIGETFIPGLNMTANEYASQQKQEAIKEGLVKPEDISNYNLTTSSTPLLSTDTVSAPLNFQSPIPKPTFTNPPHTVSLPPSYNKIFAQNVKDYGLFTGSLRAIGMTTAAAARRLGLYDTHYQTTGFSNFFSQAPQIAPYFSPIGGGLLVATGIESVTSPAGKANIATQKQSLASQGLPTELTYVNPAIQIGFGAFGLKSQLGFGKYDQLLKNPEAKVVTGTQDIARGSDTTANVIKRLELVKNNEQLAAYVKNVNKGTTIELQNYPKDTYFTDITEYRPSGKGLISNQGLNQFQGKGIITPKGSAEVIDLGKNQFKVTELDVSGKGTSKIIQMNPDGSFKTLKTVNVESPKNPPILNFGRPKTNTLRLNENFNQPYIVQDVIINGKKVTRVIEQGTGNIVLDANGKPINPDLLSSKIQGKYQSTISQGKNLKAGLFGTNIQDYSFVDVIGSGARKGMVRVVDSKGNIVELKARVGQKIVYGNPNEADIAIQRRLGLTRAEQKLISPKTSRITEEGSQARFVRAYVNPKSPLLTKLNLAQQVADKATQDAINQINKLQFELRAAEFEGKVGKGVEKIQDKISTLVKKVQSKLVTKEAGQTAISTYSGTIPSEFISNINNLPEEVIVSSPKLKGAPKLQNPNVPLQLNVLSSGENILTGSAGLIKINVHSTTITPKIQNDLINPTKTSIIQLSDPQTILDTRQELLLQPQLRTEQQNLQLQNENLLTLTRQEVQQEQALQTRQVLKQESQMQQQQQRQQNQQREEIFQTETNRPPKTVDLLLPGNILSTNQKIRKNEKKIFQAITKRRGKEIVLAETTNPLQAERIATGTALGTLARSVIVREKSSRLQVRLPNPSPALFRPAKRNPFTYIQRNPLSSKSETREIQAAKRSSGNRILGSRSFKPSKSFKKARL